MKSEAMAAIANAVEARIVYGYNYWGFEAPDSLYDALRDCMDPSTCFPEEIYRKLYAVNVRAYNGRYESHEEPADEEAPAINVKKYAIHRPAEYREHSFAIFPWHYQLAKLIDCWLYQTLEDATRADPLRLAMEEFRDGIYHFIVQHSPEYMDARWGDLPRPAPEEQQSGAVAVCIRREEE